MSRKHSFFGTKLKCPRAHAFPVLLACLWACTDASGVQRVNSAVGYCQIRDAVATGVMLTSCQVRDIAMNK